MGVYIGQSTKIYDRATGTVSYGRVPAGSVVVSGNLPSADGATACTAPSSSSAWMRRPAPRPASTTCCATDTRPTPMTTTNEGSSPWHDGTHPAPDGEKKASDVYLSAHCAGADQDQRAVCADQQPDPAARGTAQPAGRGGAPNRIEELEETGELNMGVGHLRRGPLSRQRHAPARLYAAVIRFIATTSRRWRRWACRGAGRPDHGKARPDPDGGCHRRGQEHHAGVDDRLTATSCMSGHILTIEDPIEFLFKNKRPSSTSARSAPTPSRCRSR
jgi:hypothetical protein